MSRDILIRPLSAEAFRPFGDVVAATGLPDKLINQGRCARYHDRAALTFLHGRAGLSVFEAEPCNLPLKLKMVERHPFGSQAFVPLSMDPFLVIVAPDVAGSPGLPLAFETKQGQAVNYHAGVWHGVLTPLSAPGLFAVIDRIGSGENLEEHWFDVPYVVTR